MNQATELSVNAGITVPVPRERAFELFTEQVGTWWDLEGKHIGATVPETAVMEPRTGGRWYERAADGSECDWGTVLVWEPPERVVLAWQISPQWTYEPDVSLASEIEVRFTELGPSSTRVDLVHSKIERHGPGAEQIRDAVGSAGGWPGLLEAYAAAA